MNLIKTLLFCAVFTGFSFAGKIVLCNDEWTLGDWQASAWQQPNDASQFALNVADWFTDGPTGNFLVFSNNFGLTGSNLQNTMTNANHRWTITTNTNYLSNLSAYDAIFLSGNFVDNQILINYVNGGGNVFLEGGTGVQGNAYNEAMQWNTFLNTFGLSFNSVDYNYIAGNLEINSTHEIFTNVDHLFQNNGNDVIDITATDPRAQVLVNSNGHGLYAVYNSESSPVPEPSGASLIITGLLGIIGMTKIRKR